MQVIDHTEDYIAEKPCRDRGQKQEAGWMWSSWWQTISSLGRSLDKACPRKAEAISRDTAWDRQAEGRGERLFIPLLHVPIWRLCVPLVNPSQNHFWWDPGNSLWVNFLVIRNRARAKNDSEFTGSRTAWIFLNKVTDHPVKQSQYGYKGQRWTKQNLT